jgi:flagellar motility protein MotE (MotC chaperone)
MKRLWNVLVLTLALNFMALGGAVAWLYQGGHLDHSRVQAIKAILFPPPAPEAPATQPATTPDPTTQPTLKLEELLAKHSNLPAGEQVEFIQRTFDAHMAQLDRQRRVLEDLKMQVDIANQKVAADRAEVEAQRKKLEEDRQQAQKLATDQGFQDSLNVYNAMPPKQVKQVFMTLPDDTVLRYLEAMTPRKAAKITEEFKTPEEIERIQRVLERMRRGEPATQEAKEQ